MTQVTVKKILSWAYSVVYSSIRDYCLPNKEQRVTDYQYNHREGKKEKPLESISQGPGWNSGEGEETLMKEKKSHQVELTFLEIPW